MRLIYKVLTFFLTVGFVYLIFNYSQLIKSYPIKTISFKGEFIYADEKGIRKQLQYFIGKDLIKIDILKIKESIKKNDWVNNVLVERRFPDTLFIEIPIVEYDTIIEIQYEEIVEYIDCDSGLPCNSGMQEIIDKSLQNSVIYNLQGQAILTREGLYIESGEVKYRLH